MITTIPTDVKSHCRITGVLWLFYFILSIGVVGFSTGYVICLPIFILSRIYYPLMHIADFLLMHAIWFLMVVQPWYKAKVKITLPKKSKEEGVKPKGILLVSNHRSTLDVFILLTCVPGIRVFAKSTLFLIPFLNVMMWATRQIYVPRGKLDSFFRAMEEVRHRLRKGQTVHIFPEMTRCPQGFVGVQGFSLAPFSVAMEENILVLPIVFKNTDQVWPRGSFTLSFRKPILAKSLPPLLPTNFKTADELRQEVHKQILAQVLL